MSIYIPNITLKDIKEHPMRFLIGSKGVTLEVTDVYGSSLSENVVQEVAAHGRLIDADALDDVVFNLIESGCYITRNDYKHLSNIIFEWPTVIEAEE